VTFWLAVEDYKIGLDAPVCRHHNRAVPYPVRCLDSFGEVDFFGLGIGHG
jgi:hypothetical protein